MTILIQPAQTHHIPAILEIYNEAVLNSTASYDYEPSTLEQRTQWFNHHQELGLPVFVALDPADCVVGWGSLSKFRDKIGYQYTLEHSVYIAVDQRGQGIGSLMLQNLIDTACGLGKHVLIGGVDSSNEASLRLHKTFGFEEVARFKQVGFKYNRWLDVIFFQRFLNP
ncbi:MAG: N-acetyltransferase family protein [Chloroflexota bacterium]